MTTLNSFHTELKKIYANDTLNKVLRKCQEAGVGTDQTCMTSAISDNNNGVLKDINGETIVGLVLDNIGDMGQDDDGVNTLFTTGNIYTYLVTHTSDYNNLDDFTQDLTDLSYALASSDFSDHPDKVKQYREMKRTRRGLDRKMRELYENEYTDNQLLYDNSVYVNLAWTVLATSVLYYLFVKL
jgi:hypothetical protein